MNISDEFKKYVWKDSEYAIEIVAEEIADNMGINITDAPLSLYDEAYEIVNNYIVGAAELNRKG